MERDRARGRLVAAAIAAALLLALASGEAAAVPLLTQREEIGGLIVYPDDKVASVFYYVPGRVQLAATDGTPAFSFRRIRYTGTRLMGDQGTFAGRGMLSFTVEFENLGAKVRAAEQVLRGRNRRAELRPIPVEKIEAELVYAVIESDERGRIASGIWAEPPKEPPTEGPSAGRWESKSFEIALNPRTTQVMWEAYEKGGVLLSLNYAVVAGGVSDLNRLPAEAQRRLDELRRAAEGAGAAYEEPQEAELEAIARTVRADALQIKVLPGEHPECFRSVDLDAQMPAGYVFLDVYCYDFQNDPKTPIVKKSVEIRAYGIAGGRPKVKVDFRRSTPDECSRSVHFDLAVDLNKGYEYRVMDFDDDGNVTKGDWIAVGDWTGILDVSTEHDVSPADANVNDGT
jgi:hypothetical protein